MLEIQTCQALIVDDDSTILSIVEGLLSENAITVHKASSGEEALELYARSAIDVVLTDVQMGGMSGFDLLRRLRLVNPNAKVIVMTGFDSYESVLKALQLGAYDYLQKPLTNHPAIVAAVQRAYESAKLQRENTDLLVQLTASHDQLAAANRSLIEANQKLKRLAITDSLTNLYNRRFFDQAIKRETTRRNRYQLALSVIMIDVDDFKNFNDTYGHDGGDQALKLVARVLVDSSRNSDIVARYGGEEFIVALPLTSPDQSVVYAERARKIIESTCIELKNGEKTYVKISMGIAGAYKNSQPISAKDIINHADTALYQAKRDGKNRYHLHAEKPVNKPDGKPKDTPKDKAA